MLEHNVTLRSLFLLLLDIDQDMASALAQVLTVNSSIERLILHGNRMGSLGSVEDFVVGLQQNESLRVLYLGKNNLREKDVAMVAKNLPSTVEELDLSENSEISETRVTMLRKALRSKAQLQLLFLAYCNFADKGLISKLK